MERRNLKLRAHLHIAKKHVCCSGHSLSLQIFWVLSPLTGAVQQRDREEASSLGLHCPLLISVHGDDFAWSKSLLWWEQLLLWAVPLGWDLLLTHLKQPGVALLALQGLSLHPAWCTPHEVGEPRERKGFISQISEIALL